MYSIAELVALASAYIAWANISISRMGELVADNDKLFHRLFAGLDCYARSAERASVWFNQHWPSDLAWPADVPDRRRCAVAREEAAAAAS